MRNVLLTSLVALAACGAPYELTNGVWTASSDDIVVDSDCVFTADDEPGEEDSEDIFAKVIAGEDGNFELGFDADATTGIPCVLADDGTFTCEGSGDSDCVADFVCVETSFSGTFPNADTLEFVNTVEYKCIDGECDYSLVGLEGACTSESTVVLAPEAE